MLPYVFTDLNEEKLNVITSVLDQYCVKYQKKTHREQGMFYSNTTYDVIVELDREKEITLKDGTKTTPFNFIMDKVNQALKMLGYNKEIKDKRLKEELIKREITEKQIKETADKIINNNPTLFEDLFKPNFGIDFDSIRDKAEELHKRNQFLKKLFEESNERMKKEDTPKRLSDIMKEMVDKATKEIKTTDPSEIVKQMDEKGFTKEFKDKIRDVIGTPKDIENKINDLGKDVEKLALNAYSMGALNKSQLDDIMESVKKGNPIKNLNMGNSEAESVYNNLKNDGEQIDFDDLPLEAKDMLCAQFPLSQLRSNKVKIYKKQTPMGETYSIAIDMSDKD